MNRKANKVCLECRYISRKEVIGEDGLMTTEIVLPIICSIGYKDQPQSKKAILNTKANKGIVCRYILDAYDPKREVFEKGRKEAQNESYSK